jgi:metal-dependent hydrolase (beta-lactamase superfamily II)
VAQPGTVKEPLITHQHPCHAEGVNDTCVIKEKRNKGLCIYHQSDSLVTQRSAMARFTMKMLPTVFNFCKTVQAFMNPIHQTVNVTD